MTTAAYALQDSATMLRRNLRHMRRYPAGIATAIGTPLVFLLLFVYVFGGTMGAGLVAESGAAGAGAVGGRQEYLDYITPAILMLAITGTAMGTAITIAMDMKEGIVARFRTMGIARGSVLAGHVLGDWLQTAAALAIVLAVALLLGFQPDASAGEWLAAGALLGALAFAVIWLSVALGMVTKSVEAASNLPMPLMLLPFLGSGFVPVETMPSGLRWFAEHQPFTPIMETLRSLLTGHGAGDSAALAVGWCAAIGLVGYVWAQRLFDRDPVA